MIRILIADDHAVIRAGVRTILTSRADIEVDEAVDGAQAVGKALRFKPDLVILDLTMPVMGGYAAAVELRRLAPEIPVLFFSIHEGAQLIRDAKKVGARGFLKKVTPPTRCSTPSMNWSPTRARFSPSLPKSKCSRVSTAGESKSVFAPRTFVGSPKPMANSRKNDREFTGVYASADVCWYDTVPLLRHSLWMVYNRRVRS